MRRVVSEVGRPVPVVRSVELDGRRRRGSRSRARQPYHRPVALGNGRSRSPRSTRLVGGPRSTGIDEFDRVLGGGSGARVGHPARRRAGHRQEHLAAPVGGGVADAARCTSAPRRARSRCGCAPNGSGAVGPSLWLLAETSLPHIVAAIDTVQPQLVIIDSIQSVADPDLGSAPGSVVQVRGCAHRLVAEAKSRGIPMVLVGHVTKDGGLAGPRLLEHVVDTVLSFEGDRHHALRLLRAVKHRFGSTNELGVFEMVERGLVGVPDASSLFLTDRRTGVAGSAVTPDARGPPPVAGRGPGAHQQGQLRACLRGAARRASIPAGWRSCWPCSSAVPGCRWVNTRCSHRRSVACGSPSPAATCRCAWRSSAHWSTVLSPPISSRSARSALAGELRQVAHASRRLGRGCAARLHPGDRARQLGERCRRHLADPGRDADRGIGRRRIARGTVQVESVHDDARASDRRLARGARGRRPGTPLRDGIERIVRAKMGALLVLGDGPDVLAICSGGFLLDAPFSPQRLSELAKMDGAIILGSHGQRLGPGQRAPRARPIGADQRDRHCVTARPSVSPARFRCRSSASAKRWASSACTPVECGTSCKTSAACSIAPTRRCRRWSATRCASTTRWPT